MLMMMRLKQQFGEMKKKTGGAERKDVYDGFLLKNLLWFFIAVNDVTWLHPVCSQLLTGLKVINSPAALLETDVMNGRDTQRERVEGETCLEKLACVGSVV